MITRHTPQIAFLGEEAQQKLSKSSVAIIGLGALGSVAAELLARAGVNNLILIDHDIVELSNLQRQLYTEADVNKLKVDAIAARLEKISSEIVIKKHALHINEKTIEQIKADAILDCTDNLETRFIINKHCKQNSIPWVHAAAVGSMGIILPINQESESHCFNSVYSNAKMSEFSTGVKPVENSEHAQESPVILDSALTCGDQGILNTASFTTASIQVNEALKILVGKSKKSDSKPSHLIRFNLWSNTFDIITVNQNSSCTVCNPTKKESKTNKEKFQFTLSKCTTRAGYSTKPNKNVHLNLKNIKEHFNTIVETPIVLVIIDNGNEIIVHEFGEILFKTMTDEKKMHAISQKIYEVGL